jgi:hypothetical protein
MTADTRVHDLAQSSILESRVRQPGDEEIRRVQGSAPSPYPRFVAIARKGSWAGRDTGGGEQK